MAFQVKFTAQRGKIKPAEIVVAAGSGEAQSDTISVNIDANLITRGDAIVLLESLIQKIHASPWPPLA